MNVPLEATYLMASGVVPGISRTVVRVTTDDGVVGLGEAASPSDAAALRGELGQGLVGRTTAERARRAGRHRARTRRAPGRRASAHSQSARGSRDRSLGHRGAGAGRAAARLSWEERSGRRSSSASTSRTGRGARSLRPTVAAFCARMVEEHDSPVFEGKVAVHPVEDDVRLVREVRAAIGPDRALRLDANMGWRLETAKTCARAPRAVRHRERRGARRLVRGAG